MIPSMAFSCIRHRTAQYRGLYPSFVYLYLIRRFSTAGLCSSFLSACSTHRLSETGPNDIFGSLFYWLPGSSTSLSPHMSCLIRILAQQRNGPSASFNESGSAAKSRILRTCSHQAWMPHTGLVLEGCRYFPLTISIGLTASCIRSGVAYDSTILKRRSALFSFLFHLSGALFAPLDIWGQACCCYSAPMGATEYPLYKFMHDEFSSLFVYLHELWSPGTFLTSNFQSKRSCHLG